MEPTNSELSHSEPKRPTADVQIIGAGVAGLVAANLAADAGLTVRLIERRSTLGGRAATADHRGYALNVGPHALYLQGALRRVLERFDLVPAGTAPETAGGTGAIGDRVGLLPVGPASLVRTGLLPARAKVDAARLLARLPRLDPNEFATSTVEGWIGRSVRTPEARALLHGIVNLATYNAAAEQASADAVVAQLQMAVDQGVHYVHGGWASIVDQLSARATANGVTRVEATIGHVSTQRSANDEPSTVAETTDGAQLVARTTVIAAGGPAVVDRLLGLGTVTTDAAGPAVEASALDLGLRRRPAAGAHLGLDRRLYAAVHSVAPGLAPAGRHLVSLARYRVPGEDVSPAETQALLLDHAGQMGVDPTDIDMDRYLHRLTVANGMPLAERGGLAGRPGIAVAGRPGVFVAGDWVGANGLLADAAAASAIESVAAVEAIATPERRSVRPEASAGHDRRATLVRP